MSSQLAQGVPCSGSPTQQPADPAQIQQLKQQSSNLAGTQAETLAHASSGSQSTGMLQHNGSDCLSLKEKNRHAQRKFRQKQKIKQSQAEDKAAQLAQQLKQLKAQKAAAESRNLVLEKVVELQGVQLAHKARLSMTNASNTSSCTEPEADLSNNADICRSLSLSKPPPIHSPIDLEKIHPTFMHQAKEQRITFQPEKVDWRDFGKFWKGYISRMALCLVEANGDPNSAACKQIEMILDELVAFYCHCASEEPTKTSQLKWTKLDENLDSEAANAPAPEDLWPRIVTACNFDSQQQKQICALQQYLLTNLGKILKDRAEISAQLAYAVPSQGSGTATSQVAMGHIQALQVTQKLHQNLQQAQECLTQFQLAAKQCITPLQAAISCVQAWPWMPDISALFNCVALNGEQSAQNGLETLADFD